MKNKKHWISILIVAMSLATAWAIRGQFGHEQGAAWAGAIGGLALIAVSGRKEWYNKMMLVAMASAIGWGAGGMISYGRVVGYGRTDNFVNVIYGLGMLFVIGALFGLIGGGLVGLTLDSTKKNKVKWGQLVAEMTAGGIITYYFLIEQLGVKMTPPRSEAWAVCLGAGLAMVWHMARNKRNSAMRVAVYAALGGGFGFGFGNFLQVLGNVLEINFNMWNVMEYNIGFWGGTGMAYGVFSSQWPNEDEMPEKWISRISLLFVVLFIPLIVYRESLMQGTLAKKLGQVPDIHNIAAVSHWFILIVLVIMAALLLSRFWRRKIMKKDVTFALFSLLIVYTLASYCVKGIFAGITMLNHHMYVANMVVIFILIRLGYPAVFENVTLKIPVRKWVFLFLVIMAILVISAAVAVMINPGLGGGHNRFPVN